MNTLDSINNVFNEELQKQIEGTLPKGHIYRLGMPSEALLSRLDNIPIELAASTLNLKSSNKNIHEHTFNISDISNLPKALANPIAVFESETNPNRTVVLTELKDSNDKNFVTIIRINNDKRTNTINEVNSVVSLYPKESNIRIARWFLGKHDKAIGRDLVAWVEKEKALNWLSDHSPDANAARLPIKSIAKIIQNFENPKLFEKNLLNTEGENNELLFRETAIHTQLKWNNNSDAVSNLNEKGLSKKLENEVTFVERVLSELKGITFMGESLTGRAKIESSQDVAFLFKNLESAASENAFCLLHKQLGEYSVLYLSTGTPSIVPIDVKQIAAAAKEYGADSITLVHNHPSGSLTASYQDMRIHRILSETLNVKINPSIIINLDSGKYAEFDSTSYKEIEKSNQNLKAENLKVYQFDRQKLYHNDENRIIIRCSKDIAQFLSTHKRGTANKIHLLVLGGDTRVNKYTLIDGNISRKDLLTRIVEETGKHGNSVVLASNGTLSDETLNSLEASLKKCNIELIDALAIKQNKDILLNYISARDEGILSETKQEYDLTKKKDNMIKEEKNNLSVENVEKIFEEKKDIFLKGITPSSEPHCILLGGQPAAGKSYLNLVAVNNYNTDFLQVNGDGYRKYHPDEKNLIKDFQSYSEKTQIFSNVFTEGLINEAIKSKLNVSIEGTMRNAETTLNTALRFRNEGFKTHAYVIATPDIVSELGIYDRYQREVNAGYFGRLADINIHNSAVEGLIKTVDALYNKRAIDSISIYSFRAENKIKEYRLINGNWSYFEKPSVLIKHERERLLNDKDFLLSCKERAENLKHKISPDLTSNVEKIISKFKEQINNLNISNGRKLKI